MTKLTFGYCKNIKWYSAAGWAIRVYERYMHGLDASHAYVEVTDGYSTYRIESVFPSGKITVNENFCDKYCDVERYSFHVNNSVFEIVEWARENIKGKSYSFSQNIFLAVVGLIMKLFNIKNWDWENKEFNGRVELNCTEAQIMVLVRFLGVIPTEGFDNFCVGEARDLIKTVWEIKGVNNVNTTS